MTVDSARPNRRTSYNKTYRRVLARCRINDIPTLSADRSQLQALLERTHDEVRDCNAPNNPQLTKLTACLQSLLFSPIRTLPLEILSEIFLFVADEPIHMGNRRIYTNTTNPVLKLTWVCSWWRTLALALPTLWSAMRLTFANFADNCTMPRARDFEKECILRSGTHVPLYLFIDIIYVPNRPFLHRADLDVLDVIIYQARRWKRLELELFLDRDQDVDQFRDRLWRTWHQDTRSSEFPLLEELHLQLRHSLDLPTQSPFSQIFLVCPRLHTLRISHLSTGDAIDLSHLVVLVVDHLRINGSISTLLEKSPHLQRLELHEYYEDGGLPSTSYKTSFYHTQLLTLSVPISGRDFPDGMWNNVFLPSLKHMKIRLSWRARNRLPGEARSSTVALKGMLLRSDCVLETVSVQGLWSSHSTVVSFLDGLPVTSETESRFVNGNPYRKYGNLSSLSS
ncbi:hypothetical protein GYMLUDRAFT_46450 [Collybiopsis luxurians FD-317 M1]|uniref:F-box domain-containing protein n=1 Tax=Collybiopsis luxurians FD-317 M1 TaxID=944289 RepID=A0A0D0CPF8_9AGAR|nr:hypothetical protein GYMLUDRAFT_46450 [Collybiopsis luxurians FD-317 M1]